MLCGELAASPLCQHPPWPVLPIPFCIPIPLPPDPWPWLRSRVLSIPAGTESISTPSYDASASLASAQRVLGRHRDGASSRLVPSAPSGGGSASDPLCKGRTGAVLPQTLPERGRTRHGGYFGRPQTHPWTPPWLCCASVSPRAAGGGRSAPPAPLPEPVVGNLSGGRMLQLFSCFKRQNYQNK